MSRKIHVKEAAFADYMRSYRLNVCRGIFPSSLGHVRLTVFTWVRGRRRPEDTAYLLAELLRKDRCLDLGG